MSDTRKFRTRTEFISRNNGALANSWLIGLDIGYSGVKFYSPAGYGCFPSYAKKEVPEFVNIPSDTILYRNNGTGESWLVGAVAQNNIQSGDTSDSEAVLYGRERYYDPMFMVIAETGLAMSMIDHDRDDNGLLLPTFSKYKQHTKISAFLHAPPITIIHWQNPCKLTATIVKSEYQ